MKPMLIAFAAIIVIAVGSDLILNQMGFSSADVSASSSVRLE